jgi:[protein-PII] uridylyltransferase
LWDAKLEVGQTVLTVQECIRQMRNDFRTLTSVMDARFLLGSRSFYQLFEETVWANIERERRHILGEVLIQQKKREDRYKREDYFVEPDIKEGPGGLRDLHYMAWMAKVYLKSKNLSQIKRFPAFSHFEVGKLQYSKGFLLRVRNHLHLLTKRKEDRVLTSYQSDLAQRLGYTDSSNLSSLGRFMRHLYFHLNRIRYGYEEFLTKALDVIDPLPIRSQPGDLHEDFLVVRGNIVLKEGSLLKEDPKLILIALKEANRHSLFLGSGFIWEARKKARDEARGLMKSQEAKRLFLDLVLNPVNPKILRLAHEIGIICIFIPEFKRIRNRMQFGHYHVETVDLHSLKIIEVISEISNGAFDAKWPILRYVFEALEQPDWLYLSGLLHDIGKGFGGDHEEKGATMVPRILKRLGLDGEALKITPFLIRHHLLLIKISQRRDLSDEKTSVQVAQTIQDIETLRFLFLLTVADTIATGPMASSDWKMMFLIELFLKVERILKRGVLASPDATKRLNRARKMLFDSLSPNYPEKDLSHLMEQVSTRYFLNMPLEDMVEHFHLALEMGEKRLAWTLKKLKDAPVTKIILCTYDVPGLFSKMVGIFTINNIKVLSSHIFTLKNGLAFDVYEVTNPMDIYREQERWEKIQREILAVREDAFPLDDLINRKRHSILHAGGNRNFWGKRVDVSNEISDFFTVIEVHSGERVALLYDLAKCLFLLGLDIRFAKVNRDKEKMTGVFYVRDSGGQKIYEEDEIKRINGGIFGVIK